MNIQILGTGCLKCKMLAKAAEQAVNEVGVCAEITKVTDLKQIMAFGIMTTPGLVIDGVVKVSGRVPSVAEIKSFISE